MLADPQRIKVQRFGALRELFDFGRRVLVKIGPGKRRDHHTELHAIPFSSMTSVGLGGLRIEADRGLIAILAAHSHPAIVLERPGK